MSLADFVIESFGGYEKAKAVLDIPNAHFLHNIEGLKQRLLEYRHQHNIFEVGDKVVFVSEKMDFLDDDQIHSISVITENNLPKVCGLYVSFEVIKHATDEEIKAGGRLKANPIDSDIDKQVNLMDQFIADGGFDKAFVDVFGLPESVKQSLKEIS